MSRRPARLTLVLTISALGLLSGSASAEFYRWTDADGNTHFTSDLGSVPPAYREQARASAATTGRTGHINQIDTPAAPAARETPERLRDAQRPASPNGPAADADLVDGRDEASWRADAERYAREIEQLEQQVEACEDVSVPDRYDERTGRYKTKRQHYDRKMAAVEACSQTKSRLDVTRRQQENFAERARRRGVPPGWLRVR
ncbi:MAG: DUF4124 domain-containing protein [Spirochaetaceae bacterium]|nr:DUF4124 domain-containing protein [Spirochaetaceae bacterium]HPG25805.1 DUF4124 domain-containing protein [Myxococcota bacterium]